MVPTYIETPCIYIEQNPNLTEVDDLNDNTLITELM